MCLTPSGYTPPVSPPVIADACTPLCRSPSFLDDFSSWLTVTLSSPTPVNIQYRQAFQYHGASQSLTSPTAVSLPSTVFSVSATMPTITPQPQPSVPHPSPQHHLIIVPPILQPLPPVFVFLFLWCPLQQLFNLARPQSVDPTILSPSLPQPNRFSGPHLSLLCTDPHFVYHPCHPSPPTSSLNCTLCLLHTCPGIVWHMAG